MARQKTFTIKNYGTLYKWSVTPGPQGKEGKKQVQVECGSTYAYNGVVVNGQLERLAYVECGYVK